MPEQINITNSSLSAFQEMLHHTRAQLLVWSLVSHHNGQRDTWNHRKSGWVMIRLLRTVIQLDPRGSAGAPGGPKWLLRCLDLRVQADRPLSQNPNLFLRIRASGSMSTYGNKFVSQRSSESPTSTFLGQALAYRERFHANQQVGVSLLLPEHNWS